ncbi:helix-turn-helix domain-containing protein [Microbacterium sp. NPDC058342]|uniref:helix-turn-helix domain-containing protein n=1 Tax=Microbacterium sp. NPDC058342 TaxID=3346454 RepID=UPI00364E9489
MIDARRGILYPGRMPRFHRLPPTASAEHLVAWFWIPEWDLPPGESSRQEVVAYPALNLVADPSGLQLVGATTRATHRDLTGSGWAVGALLRPAGVAALTDAPAALRDSWASLEAPEMLARLTAVMAADGGERIDGAVSIVSQWLADRAGAPTDAGLQANAMSDLLMTDATVRTAEQAATRLAVSLRTLQRMTHRYVGLPPLAMIRRRRLQDAAQRLRENPDADLAALAAELGYADHAHLTGDFRDVLGVVPSGYRRELSGAVLRSGVAASHHDLL